jgi:subfamily B ATP-binding cassette protein MsbA
MKQQKVKIYDFGLYRRIVKYLKNYWIAFVLAMLGNIVYSGIDAWVTYLLKPILDKGFIARDAHFLHVLPLFILALFIFRGAASFVGDYFISYVSRGVIMRFRQEIFGRLMKLPAYFFDNNSTGKILSIIIYNVEQISSASADTLTDLVQNGFFVLGLIVVMFSISWKLSLIFLLIVPPLAIVVDRSNRRLRRINRDIQHKMGDVTCIAEEAIEGYKVIRSFGGEEYETSKFNAATNRNRQFDLKTVTTKSLTSALTPFLAGSVLILIIYLATSNYHGLSLSAGAFVSLVAAMMALIKPLKRFTSLMASIQRGLAGAQSVFELIDEPAEKDEGAVNIDRVRGKVRYQGVTFSYPKSEKIVLNNVSFDIEPGKIVALVGHSGGGKSTIASLLPRFYDVEQGAIYIDDVNVKDYKLSNLRQQFAVVSQHVTLFNDTVRHNIAYGQFAAVSDAEVIHAAKMANAWEFIEQMPKGLDTLVGENGVLLSGGQRQRIAIARAILKNAPILILDEATSALDTNSERLIQSALDELMKCRTTLVIAHRLSTIEHADKILVVEHGAIVENGTHDELMEQDGYYAKLHNMQFRN